MLSEGQRKRNALLKTFTEDPWPKDLTVDEEAADTIRVEIDEMIIQELITEALDKKRGKE